MSESLEEQDDLPRHVPAEYVVACRSCGESRLERILDLGTTPLANELRRDPAVQQAMYPLAVVLCPSCSLVQTSHRLPGEVLFGRSYPYFSSVSNAYLKHASEHARELIARRRLGRDSFVVEVASNDGYLLSNFVDRGIPVLGIDPADGPAAVARARGVETLVEYFGMDVALRLRNQGIRAELILGNNVLAHVNDVNDFVAGVACLLKEEGEAVFEVPYLLDMVERCAFDTIYHEHNCYFSLTALRNLFERHGLRMVDVRRLPVHGGSLRITVAMCGEPSAAVLECLAVERALCVADRHYYESFQRRVRRSLDLLRSLLNEIRAEGKCIAAYAAAAKGAVIINGAGLDQEDIAYVVDRNPRKQNNYMPGSRIPIVHPDKLRTDPPDYLLVFAWNLVDEIRSQLTDFKGRYIVPIPEPRVI